MSYFSSLTISFVHAASCNTPCRHVRYTSIMLALLSVCAVRACSARQRVGPGHAKNRNGMSKNKQRCRHAMCRHVCGRALHINVRAHCVAPRAPFCFRVERPYGCGLRRRNDGSLVIGESVDGRGVTGVQFWSCRRESSCHMARR